MVTKIEAISANLLTPPPPIMVNRIETECILSVFLSFGPCKISEKNVTTKL